MSTKTPHDRMWAGPISRDVNKNITLPEVCGARKQATLLLRINRSQVLSSVASPVLQYSSTYLASGTVFEKCY
jgi:hypothetical protein